MAERKIKPDYLSQKQFDFLEYWIQTNNCTESAIKAGYSERTAKVQGSRFLSTDKAKQYITERMAELDAEKIATSDEVLQYLTSVMRGEVKDQFDLDPSLSDRNKAADMLAKILLKANEKSVIPVQIVNDIPRSNPIKQGKLTTILQETQEKQNSDNKQDTKQSKELTEDKQITLNNPIIDDNRKIIRNNRKIDNRKTTRRGVLC